MLGVLGAFGYVTIPLRVTGDSPRLFRRDCLRRHRAFLTGIIPTIEMFNLHFSLRDPHVSLQRHFLPGLNCPVANPWRSPFPFTIGRARRMVCIGRHETVPLLSILYLPCSPSCSPRCADLSAALIK